MRKIFRALALVTLALSLSACITIGNEFPIDKLSHLQAGVTHRTDVERLFGKPWRVGIDSGMRTWTYAHYKYKVFGEPQTRDLVVRFDKEGKVVSFTYNSTYHEDDKP